MFQVNQALFSSKDKSKKLKCLLLQFLFRALRVKEHRSLMMTSSGFTLLNKLALGILRKI